jgi:glycine hydroxymethyltransferase
LKLILSHTEAEPAKDGRSKAKFTIEAEAETEARQRIRILLASFPVYPQLDLSVLARHFL